MIKAISTEVKVNLALAAVALVICAGFFLNPFSATAADVAKVEIVDLTAALDMGQEIIVANDASEARYNDMRAELNALSDVEVLVAYRANWLDLRAAKADNVAAADKAELAHGLWREIVQRGLVARAKAPEYAAVVEFLVADNA